MLYYLSLRGREVSFPILEVDGRRFLQPNGGERDQIMRWNWLTRYFGRTIDWFGIREFPLLWQAVLMNGRPENMHRVGLVNFFLGNGLPPWGIEEFFAAYPGSMDAEARNHVHYLVYHPFPYKYWDMRSRRYQDLRYDSGGRLRVPTLSSFLGSEGDGFRQQEYESRMRRSDEYMDNIE